MIDTKINHVTKIGANLFLELGFEAHEAECLQLESLQKIQDEKTLKDKLKVISPRFTRQEALPLFDKIPDVVVPTQEDSLTTNSH